MLTAAAKRQRLDLRSPTSRSYLDAVALSQEQFEARLAREVPGAVVYRRYRIVFNGLAVSLPAGAAPAARAPRGRLSQHDVPG